MRPFKSHRTPVLLAALLPVLSLFAAGSATQMSQGFAPQTPYVAPRPFASTSSLDAFVVDATRHSSASVVLRGPDARVVVWPVGVPTAETGLRLLDPQGTPFAPDGRTEAAFAAGSSAELSGLVDLPPTATLLKISPAAPGRYTLDFSHAQSGAKAFMVAVQDGSGYRMRVSLSEMVSSPGGHPVLYAKLFNQNSGAPLPGFRVTAMVRSTSAGSPVRVILRDDGVAPDATAGDGVYSCFLPVEPGGGMEDVKVDASGTADGLPLHRVGHAALALSEGGFRILGARPCQVLRDPTGVSAVEVPVRVKLPKAGTYRLQATLTGRSPSGAEVEVAYASVEASLEAGERTMTLRFAGQDLSRADVDPPYLVRDASLLDIEAIRVAAQAPRLGRVAGFTLAELPPPAPAPALPSKHPVPAP
ncbi:MAG: choice-of-anchor X domain-containing protein [Acidobacteriota bacterium]